MTGVVRNDEAQLIDVDICVTPVQIDIDGVWTDVWRPICISSGLAPVAAGDSAVVLVNVFAYLRPNAVPQFDPRMVPGRYRLLFFMRRRDPGGPIGSGQGETKASPPFIVRY